jgi:hypothetical protein
LTHLEEIENRAGIARVTCGWKKPQLPLDAVRRYWRDVHSPAIARRQGVYDYRHYQFDAVRNDVFAPVAGIDFACAADAQLMWLSDVRYVDDAALATFGTSPDGEVKAQLLADIELIVDKSTTYKAVGSNARTLLDRTGTAAPQGPVGNPGYCVFFRQRSDEASFRACVQGIAERWARTPGVLRVRLSMFEVPDMEAEKKAGYPVKTHPVEHQYQAWIDLVVADERSTRFLLTPQDGTDYARHLRAIHAYPVLVVYTSVYAGRPTLVGLRGYAAYLAITELGGDNQRAASLLEWMYGPVAAGGPIEVQVP